ncbi:MAG: pilus assembly protein PilM, partial [Patescibacteria group bacterium]
LIGIPNEAIKRYKKIFKEAGLKIIALEIESFSLVRALNRADDVLTLTVDIGAEATNVIVSKNGILKYSSETDYGGIYITQALSRSLGISALRAEELKRRRGLTGRGGEMELSTLLIPFLDVIIQECRHVKDVYERQYGEKIEKLHLTGGGANLLGIERYFGSQINLPLASLATLGGVDYESNLEPVMKNLTNELLISIGLARRYFE